MRAFRILFLILVFALTMLFLVQNTHVLDTRAELILDLWWKEFRSPEIAVYIYIFICLMLGVIFGAVAFLPGNKELRDKRRLQKMTINKLAMEISKMQKKDEILEEKQEGEAEEQKVEHEEIREPASLPRMDQAGPGGAAGRAALVAVLVLFILLSVFYFYTDQKITQLDNQIGATLENSTLAVEIAEKVDQETEGFKKDIAELNKALDRHDQEIEALQDLPRETMNYLTMMLLNEYTVQADRLLDRAETEEDRKMLRQVQSVLEKAVNHYREKVSD